MADKNNFVQHRTLILKQSLYRLLPLQYISLSATQSNRTNLRVSRWDPLVGSSILLVGMCAVGAHTVDAAGNDEGEELLARPLGPRFEHTRHGQTAVPRRQIHQQLHHVRLYTQTATQRLFTKSDEFTNFIKRVCNKSKIRYTSDGYPELCHHLRLSSLQHNK